MKVFTNYEIPEGEGIVGDLAATTMKLQSDLLKYKLMWALRGLESEIVEEGGMIIINSTGAIETKQFTPGLTVRIHEALTDSNWAD